MEIKDFEHLNRPVPRYTSYPTALAFYPLGLLDAIEALQEVNLADRPLSLYLHIPFCSTMCLFCGCSVVLNRSASKQSAYVDLMCREMALVAAHFSRKKRVTQIHFGGGTPTMLDEVEFEQILASLKNLFDLGPHLELSIEIDPRTVHADEGKKLHYLRRAGFNRVSFGVQDLDPTVQKAVRRHQSEEMTVATYQLARELGFSGINLDLIYGLPFQTRESFRRTAEKIAELSPDRIALFSYAKIPWIKAHQKAMPEHAEPSPEEKLQIYIDAREIFLRSGYVAIGMDHFSLESDSLARAYQDKTLWRNFQGYSLRLADDLLGFGITAIGNTSSTYLQNVKTIEEYRQAIEAGRLPVLRGFKLSDEDQRRRYCIQTLMCHFELDKREFERLFQLPFDLHFASCREALEQLSHEGLLKETKEQLLPTAKGRLFIRLIASAFDAYLKKTENQYSKSV